jgi:glycosyltransferase involved in cell wall biosynthesis
MRIAMIGSRGVPAGSGGVERVVEEIARELTARGHDVLVYGRACYLGRPAPWPGFARVLLTPGLSGKHTEAITHTATACWDVLRRGVDVVHVHCAGPALMSWLPAAAGRPVVLTVHAPDWRRRRWSPAARTALRAGLAVGMRSAGAVTAVSLTLADQLADRYGREVLWVPNGVRAGPACAPDAADRRGLRPGGYALNVGRIVPEKRLDLLIEAWRRVPEQLELAIVGDAQDAAFAAECRRLAGPRVRWLGPVYGAELAGLYAGAAMVVQPSELEGMSLVLAEAAAAGRCIVAGDLPGSRELLGEAMLVFDGTVGGLVEAVRRALADGPLRRRLGEAARRRVTERFAWGRIADEYERVYEDVSRRRRPREG